MQMHPKISNISYRRLSTFVGEIHTRGSSSFNYSVNEQVFPTSNEIQISKRMIRSIYEIHTSNIFSQHPEYMGIHLNLVSACLESFGNPSSGFRPKSQSNLHSYA